MNQDLFHSLMGAKTPKGGLRAVNCFSTHIVYAYHQETFRTKIEKSHIFGSNVYAKAFLHNGATPMTTERGRIRRGGGAGRGSACPSPLENYKWL